MGGDFATVYLSPKDYHRVHMPLAGTLKEMVYVPGRLFSVNQTTAENVPELFARNERVVCLFDTERGPMAVVLVGAMIVASIETVWAGLVTPPRRELKSVRYDQPQGPTQLDKGAEIGRFKLGSTAIVLFGPEQVQWAANLGETSPGTHGSTTGIAPLTPCALPSFSRQGRLKQIKCSGCQRPRILLELPEKTGV